MTAHRAIRGLIPRRGWPLVLLLVWCALTVVALVPVWHQRMLPLLDTPNHLALARAWHDYRDPASHIADHYVLRLRLVPYVLFYALIHALLYVCKIEVANKLVLSLYLIAFPLSLLALARALDRSSWLALGGFALAFNPAWAYGFTSYLLATCCMYFGWALLLQALDDGRRRWLCGLAAVAVIAYLAHVLAWALFGLGAIVLLLLERQRWRRGLAAALALAPSLLLGVWTFVDERHERAYTHTGDQLVARWRSLAMLAREMPKRMLELFPGPLDMVVLATVVLTAALLLVLPAPAPPNERARRGTRRLLALIAMLLLAYAVLPYSVVSPMSWWYVGPRAPALLTPLLLLLPSGELTGRRRLVLLPMLIACVALPLQLARLYHDFSRRHAGFLRLAERVPRGARTLVLAGGLLHRDGEVSGDGSSSTPVYWHFLSWPMALRGGMSPNLFDQGFPVRPRPGLTHYEPMQTVFLGFADAPDFDFYLVYDLSDSGDARVRLVDRDGDWSLYRRVLRKSDEP